MRHMLLVDDCDRPVRVSSRGIAVRPRFMRSTTPRRQAASRKEQQ